MLKTSPKANRTVHNWPMPGALLIVIAFWLVPGPGFSQDIVPSPRIVVKFAEGLEICPKNGQISGRLISQSDGGKISGVSDLNETMVATDIEKFNGLLKHPGIVRLKPLFTQNASGLQPEDLKKGEPNLRLYFHVVFKDLPKEDMPSFISQMLELSIVETAYQAPIPEDAGKETPPN